MTTIAIVNLITRTPVAGTVPPIPSNRQTPIYHLARALALGGMDVTVFVADIYRPQDLKEEQEEPFRVIYVPTVLRASPVFPVAPALFGLLRNRYDIVLTSEVTQPSTFFCLLSKWTSRRQRLVVWQEMAAHQSVGRGLPSRIYHASYVTRALAHGADLFVPRGISSARFLAKYVPARKIAAPILHGADGAVFYPAEASRPFDWSFVYPARLVPEKNVDQALDIIAALRARGYPARLTVVGNGPLLDPLRQRIAREGLADAVQVQSERLTAGEMRALYVRCSAMLVTTHRDLALLSVVEAIAAACPVIIGSDADIAKEIEAHELGVVVHDRQTASYVEGCIRLGTDAAFRARCRANAIALRPRFTDAAGQFLALFASEGYLSPDATHAA